MAWQTDHKRRGPVVSVGRPGCLSVARSLHVSGFKAMARRGYHNRVPEALLLALHMAAYLTVFLLVLSPLKALVFIAVQQGLFGLYLGCSFAPNHKGMPILSRADDSDFLRRQVLTARNVRGGRFIDLLLGGLNYQIEHHLFPSMPARRCAVLNRWFTVLPQPRRAVRGDQPGRLVPAGAAPPACGGPQRPARKIGRTRWHGTGWLRGQPRRRVAADDRDGCR
jgi:hypothetical protein